AEVLHRRIEALLDDRVQAVDLVDEEDVVLPELREEARERALVLDDGAVRRMERDAHLVREDLRERRLAEAGRPREEQVIERLAALLRRLDEDAQVVLVLRLPDVIVERRRTERSLEPRLVAVRLRIQLADFALGHRPLLMRPHRAAQEATPCARGARGARR